MKILCFDSKFGFHLFPGQLRGAGDPLLFAEAEMPRPGWRIDWRAATKIRRKSRPGPFRAK